MQEPRLRPDQFGDVGQEGDDVMLHLAFDLVDPVDVEDRTPALFPDGPGGFLGDHAEFGHLVGSMGLDLEHDGEARLGLPDAGEFGAGVARDHASGF